MKLIHFYRKPALSKSQVHDLFATVSTRISAHIKSIETEYCYNVDAGENLDADEIRLLTWLLSETFEPENFSDHSFLIENSEDRACLPDRQAQTKDKILLEVGPRMNFTTAWSTNAVSVCHACGLGKIRRIERSRRYRFDLDEHFSKEQADDLSSLLVTRHAILFFDRMTECPYPEPLDSFQTGIAPQPVFEIPLVEEGKSALEKINREMGLGLDAWDIDYYYDLFVGDIGRNPTNVECFDLSQSNSEHSRHWFFKGKLIVDGNEASHNLIELIKEPLDKNHNNSVIAFNDNSSSIRGYEIKTIVPEHPGGCSRFITSRLRYDPLFTAETHNFPSGVAPFPGAETGTGGRIRDVQATGRGGLVMAGTAAYCVGNLFIPDYTLPWEDSSFIYPGNLASPLEIEIQASNGASDYGNKFGEPVIQGYTRSFGLRMPDGERYEWIKPIMFTAGIGQMDAGHVEKGQPDKDMLVVKIGGPAYRIGIGGGAASSMIQGENLAELDFNAVQRGDAEMEQKMNRVLRACVERGNDNPIVSIHDQGAGGNCNVVKEIIYPAGAKIEVRKIQVGDSTLSVLEIWGAEYQEQNALLIEQHNLELFEKMCLREKVSFAVIGRISGDGRIVLYDETDDSTPVNLDLEKVLGDMPQKTFHLDRQTLKTEVLRLPEGITVQKCLERVLRLLSVGSKRFLTNKVDRSVTGLVARQQCAGPLQLTVADVAVVAQSHFGLTGAAISIGEQPVKTLLNPAAMARLSVGEALTNMVWAKISALEDIKCSGNWMWAAKLPGEGARLYDAAVALSEVLTKLGIAIDGGKDSLSMAAQVTGQNLPAGQAGTELRAQGADNRQQTGDEGPKGETVKAPGTLVISAYATCPDVTKVITPDLKGPGESRLMFIDLGKGKNRLGGSALAQVFSQIGQESPDMDDTDLFQNAFRAVQRMIFDGLILSGHDRSDGGLITTLLEMAFAGNCGIEVELCIKSLESGEGNPGAGTREEDAISFLFSEELGLVIEYLPNREEELTSILRNSSVDYQIIGRSLKEKQITIKDQTLNSEFITLLDEDMRNLRALWEETSYQLEKLQTNPECAEEERRNIFDREAPKFKLSFTPEITPVGILNSDVKHKIAIIREEGSNSDREMSGAFFQAGFEPW
ncbi:MAG: phosphoribosylformylglycinamidine synthase, partial [Nitrospiraceae bacterium]